MMQKTAKEHASLKSKRQKPPKDNNTLSVKILNWKIKIGEYILQKHVIVTLISTKLPIE